MWTNDAHTSYAGFADLREMPRFNHHNPEVVSYLSDAALFWLDLDSDGDFTDGVDGFRVDNVIFPPQEFLVALRQAVKGANPDALLLGEAWVLTPALLSRYFTDKFDALFDFPLYGVMQGSQDLNGDGLLAGKGFPVQLTALLADEERRYPSEAIPVRFFSNHDTNRITTEVSQDPSRLRLSAALLASLPGPMLVYYGEEIGMPGQKGGPPGWDNYRREPMDWYASESGEGQASWFKPDDRWNRSDDGISVEEQEADPDSLLNFYRRVLNTRRGSAALSSGDFEVLELETTAPGAWGLVRSAGDEKVVGLYNFSEQELEVSIPAFPFSADILVDRISGQSFPAASQGQPYSLQLPPAAALWLAEGEP
jgi:glycosidase